MVLLTFIFCACLISSCNCFQFPSPPIGDNAVVLIVLAAFGTISLIGACSFCFVRRKKTFEKLENEAGSPENLKKNEYPIFRALATEINESSAIVPCERNNLSRDNLLNSSDNLTTNEHDESDGGVRKIDASDVVILLDKSLTQQRSQQQLQQQTSRDTITFETEKKHQHSPSSKTPLLYAKKNVQSYQEQQPQQQEQFQQKSITSALLSTSSSSSSSTKAAADFDGFYNIPSDDVEKLEEIDNFIGKNTNTSSSIVNPFFNSTCEDFNTVKDAMKIDKDDASEVESSINDNSEKYQILEEETDGEDILKVDDSPAIRSQHSKSHRESSDYSASEDKSVEEALRALDIAIGFDDDEEEDGEANEIILDEKVNKLEEVREEANFLVDSIVNDCEKILEEKRKIEENPLDFDDFLAVSNVNMSTPCAAIKTTKLFSSTKDPDVAKVLFPGGIDLSDGIIDATFPISPNDETYEVINDKTFDASPRQPPPPVIRIEKDKDEVSSEDMTTVTPVNTPIELSYSSETWDKMSYGSSTKGAISNEATPSSEITFNNDGWYLHPQKNDTFDIYCDDEENEDGDGGNMEDMTSTFDQLRRQLTEMLPHAQGMSVHNDFLDDDDLTNKDSTSPSDNYGIKYGELDEASNAASFDILGSLLNPEPVTELNINYNNNIKRPLSPILEESECDESVCRTFVFNNETKLLDSTSTGVLMESGDAAVMGQMPKTLMASNDTLFNFEDTLSDHTDNLLMSPRLQTAGSSTSSTLSRNDSHDRISNERTPTNEDLPKIAIDILKNNIRQHPLSLDLSPMAEASTSKYELAKIALEEGSWPLELPEAQQIVNDLSSPEQNPTADSLSFEQDMTYTIDDQKTCVSIILKNDDERISEISEPLFVSESLDAAFADDANSLQIDDALSLDIDDNFNCNIETSNGDDGDENGNQTKEIEMHVNETSSLNYDNDSINPSCGGDNLSKFDVDSLEPEAKLLNEDIEADSIANSHATKSVCSADSIDDDTAQVTVQSSENSESNSLASPQRRKKKGQQVDNSSSEESDDGGDNVDVKKKKKVQSSTPPTMATLTDFLYSEVFHTTITDDGGFGCGCSSKDINFCHFHYFENDPWGSSHDIRQVSCNQSMMSTSFTKEWSDDDSSHSSEEFMYVKGTIDVEKIISPSDGGNSRNDEQQKEEEQVKNDEQKNSENIDDLKHGTIVSNEESDLKEENEEANSDEGDESEGEFVPSCWDQSLQPSKSSLKSPERESSAEVKTRRRVAFKIQRYHSVYEYPSEVVQLSPAYSEPQLWSNYDYSGNIDFFTYTNPLADELEGFNVSSSSRPFQNSHNIQLHNTWPNESTDFSWSQYQENDDIKSEEVSLSKIEWPTREEDSGCLCESSDSHSMGELNHAKNSLRLQLDLISSTCSEISDFMSTTMDVLTKDLDAVKVELSTDESPKPPNTVINMHEDDADMGDGEDDEEINDSILPTPLSGSIDSLSSSSHSASTNNSSPPSFTTFGKEAIIKEESGKTQTIIFIEDDGATLTRIDSQKRGKGGVDAMEKGGAKVVLLQSSDDDSGFENHVQIKCEAK